MTQRMTKKGEKNDSVTESAGNETRDREDVGSKGTTKEESIEDTLRESGLKIRQDAEDPAPDDTDHSVDHENPELDAAQAQIEELKEHYLRARAEADNIRKRAELEIVNARKFALEGFARELLSVVDSLELARSVDLEIDSNSIVTKVAEGLDLTVKQLEAIFERFSIEEICPEPGDKLDPEQHQAMSTEGTSRFEPNAISRVVQKGYQLHNRLLRPAMVIVAKAPEDT